MLNKISSYKKTKKFNKQTCLNVKHYCFILNISLEFI